MVEQKETLKTFTKRPCAVSNQVRALTVRTLCALAFIISVCSCSDDKRNATTSPSPLKIRQIKLIHPPEARTLISSAVEIFNAANHQLPNGEVIRISASSLDDIGMFSKIGSQELQAALWISPSTALAASARKPAPSDINVTECQPLMSSDLGVAYRYIDSFTLPAELSEVPVGALMDNRTNDEAAQPALVLGVPRFTSSGVLAALVAAAHVSSTPLQGISKETVSQNIARMRDLQAHTRNFFISDYEALSLLTQREGGHPLALITTEQNFKLFKSYKPTAKVNWKALSEPKASLDYPLCVIETKANSTLDIEATKVARLFFLSVEFQALVASAGFSPPSSAVDADLKENAEAIDTILSRWSEIRRPSMILFVIDTSVRMDRPTLESIRREIKMFIDTRSSKSDEIGIISASSNPDILAIPSSNSESLHLALSKITTSGGNAIRDGLETAFDLFGDINSLNYRRSIVVFTTSKDTSSQASSLQTFNRASQFVGRSNVELFVLGFAKAEQQLDELPKITHDVGGSFILTNVGNLPADLFSIRRKIQ